MRYQNLEWTIRELMLLIDENKINLRPPYQRNFIWPTKDQKFLIESIKKGYPLPNFFILDNGNGNYEMLDGQQRAVTIHKFINNEFADLDRKLYKDFPQDSLMDYKLNIVLLDGFNEEYESKEEFFYLVNKRGVQLNPSEVNHAYYHDSDFMKLVIRMSEHQPLIDLDIFTDKTKLRMNDRSLIEEIAAYLFKGISDKRNAVEDLFKAKIAREEVDMKFDQFCRIIDRIKSTLSIKPINETRYKQRNDFYTLFCFIDKHISDSIELFELQYRILAFISESGLISPSNESYNLFKEYAINCVSQSNSKKAREARLLFFEELLANRNECINNTQGQLIRYIEVERENRINISKIDGYLMINI